MGVFVRAGRSFPLLSAGERFYLIKERRGTHAHAGQSQGDALTSESEGNEALEVNKSVGPKV